MPVITGLPRRMNGSWVMWSCHCIKKEATLNDSYTIEWSLYFYAKSVQMKKILFVVVFLSATKILFAQDCNLDKTVDDFTGVKITKSKSKKIYEIFIPIGEGNIWNLQIQFIKAGDSLFLKFTREKHNGTANDGEVSKIYIKLSNEFVFKREK